jgi:UDP-N-acetylmuramate dehydrogenase
VEIATAEGIGWIERSHLPYRYRHTAVNGVATRVRFLLRRGDMAQSQAQMDADLGYRKRTQPLSQPSFGSVFQNPPGDFAGRLIEAAGLKGFIIGQAQISALHANWIVNLGGATARDVVSLMELARSRVRDQSGIELRPEVRRVGIFT